MSRHYARKTDDADIGVLLEALQEEGENLLLAQQDVSRWERVLHYHQQRRDKLRKMMRVRGTGKANQHRWKRAGKLVVYHLEMLKRCVAHQR